MIIVGDCIAVICDYLPSVYVI